MSGSSERFASRTRQPHRQSRRPTAGPCDRARWLRRAEEHDHGGEDASYFDKISVKSWELLLMIIEQRDRSEDTFGDRRATHRTGHRQNVVAGFWREAKQP